MAGDLPGCEDEVHRRRGATEGVQPRTGGHDRSCKGRHSDGEAVRL
jgi:hypothetical protein